MYDEWLGILVKPYVAKKTKDWYKFSESETRFKDINTYLQSNELFRNRMRDGYSLSDRGTPAHLIDEYKRVLRCKT